MKQPQYTLDINIFFKRIGLLVFIIYLLTCGLIISGRFVSNAEVIPTYSTYTVSEGDTLWGIATAMNTDYDINKVVYDIKTVNNMSDGYINAGQIIKIPEY